MKKSSLYKLFFLFGVTVLLWIGSIYLVNEVFPTWEYRAFFGDSFGAINALFSGLAFGGIIYTILLQHEELGLQREELQQTREELKRTADAQEKNNKYQDEQLRLSVLPYFDLEINNLIKNKGPNLIIKNISGNTAFDVDIHFYYRINNSKNVFDYFRNYISKYGTTNEEIENNVRFKINKNVNWNIHGFTKYSFFPTNKKVTINTFDPAHMPYGGIYIFIQFKDSLQNNYNIKFDIVARGDSQLRLNNYQSTNYVVRSVSPENFFPIPERVLLEDYEYSKVVFDEHIYIQEILKTHNFSVEMDDVDIINKYNEPYSYPITEI